MTFTTTPPTAPGFYAWRHIPDESVAQAFHVREWYGELYGVGCNKTVVEMGGEWCRLVPAEEVERAWNVCKQYNPPPSDVQQYRWNNSRAKQVAEGTI